MRLHRATLSILSVQVEKYFGPYNTVICSLPGEKLQKLMAPDIDVVCSGDHPHRILHSNGLERRV